MRGFTALLVATGCVLGSCSTAPLPGPRWWFEDGISLDGPIMVHGEQSRVVGEQLSLWTWPELSPVPHSVTVEPWPDTVEAPQNTVAVLTPHAPLEARWYAVRWTPDAVEPADARVLGGVPMSDGSIIWRVFGVAVPEVARILGAAAGLRIELTANVRPINGRSPSSVARATQGEVICEPVFAGEAIIESVITLECSAELDWSRVVEVRIDGLESSNGVPLPELSLTISFDPGEEPVFEPTRTLTPPPVPAALCAEVDCE